MLQPYEDGEKVLLWDDGRYTPAIVIVGCSAEPDHVVAVSVDGLTRAVSTNHVLRVELLSPRGNA